MTYVNDEFFDKTYCLTCLNKVRIEHCKNQFKKHNLNVDFWYNPTIPRLERFIGNFDGGDYYNSKSDSKELSIRRNKGAMMCGIGHYNMIKTSYELGYDRILIFEDDITFKDDVDLYKVFSVIPKDADSICYNISSGNYYTYTNSYITSNIYRKYDGGLEPIRSTKMYYVNRKAQKEIINMYESWLNVSDLIWNNFSSAINKYINTYNFFTVNNNVEYSLIDH